MSSKKQICYKLSNIQTTKLTNYPKIHSYDVYKNKKNYNSNPTSDNLNLIVKDDFSSQFKKINQNNHPKYNQNLNEITKMKFEGKNRNESSNNNLKNIKLTKKINQDFSSDISTYRRIENIEINNRKKSDLKLDSTYNNSTINKIQIDCSKINNNTEKYEIISKESDKSVSSVKIQKIKKDKIFIDSKNNLLSKNKNGFICHENIPEEIHFFYVKNIQYGKMLEGHGIEGE